jgi:chromosome segregation ATPase
MPDVDEINSNLGALEHQLEELSRLKGLVQSLSQREAAAGEAVQAAEQASRSSREVIERFEDATTRIEEAEVVEQFEEIGDTIERFEEVGRELESQIEILPEALRSPLEEHQEKIGEALTEALSAFEDRLDRADDSLAVLQNALEQRLDRHHSEVTSALESTRKELTEHRDQTAEKLGEISSEIEAAHELLQETQLKSRLETLQDTASNANQAAQNGLSRIDAAERSLSDTLDEHRRRQERRADELEEEVEDLNKQLREFETFAGRLLWALLAVGLLTLVLGGSGAYIFAFTP